MIRSLSAQLQFTSLIQNLVPDHSLEKQRRSLQTAWPANQRGNRDEGTDGNSRFDIAAGVLRGHDLRADGQLYSTGRIGADRS